MTKIIWLILVLVLIGNSFFVLPYHFTENSISKNYFINYKKDSVLLRTVFPDSIIHLKLYMPPLYDSLYYKSPPIFSNKQNFLVVNVSILDNLDFFSLTFPFYKTINLRGKIDFYSTIKIENQPGRDSIALIGNIMIYVWLSIKGICTPQYVRSLVEKEFVDVLHKEMSNVEKDISRTMNEEAVAEKTPAKRNTSRKGSRSRKR